MRTLKQQVQEKESQVNARIAGEFHSIHPSMSYNLFHSSNNKAHQHWSSPLIQEHKLLLFFLDLERSLTMKKRENAQIRAENESKTTYYCSLQ